MTALKQAYILVEALVAAAMLAIISMSILPVISQLTNSSTRYDYDTAANLYLTEGIEVSYNALLTQWDLSSGNYIIVSGATTTLSSGASDTLAAKYIRKIKIDLVCRNSTAQQAPCPSDSTDNHSKTITVTITWTDQNGTSRTKTASLLVYNPR
jgi:hypothetical protein